MARAFCVQSDLRRLRARHQRRDVVPEVREQSLRQTRLRRRNATLRPRGDQERVHNPSARASVLAHVPRPTLRAPSTSPRRIERAR